ncbi:MAG: DUF2892 domain-containing protein [Saprospiraceae bacterium]|nr:DUF2892 domain-containing protein [Saprospiraceae bacterium]
MQKNIDPISRLIRLVFFDILLGGPLTGVSMPAQLSLVSGIAAVFLLATIITGFCPLVALFRLKFNPAKKQA